jgi:hypothetical protein
MRLYTILLNKLRQDLGPEVRVLGFFMNLSALIVKDFKELAEPDI